MTRGRELELAVVRAAVKYRREGRCVLLRQFPQTGSGADGSVRYVGPAPIDFVGCYQGGRCLALECKEVATKSLPLARIEDHQREALEVFRQMGADVRVCVDFTGAGEVYTVDWLFILAFLDAPWRSSLSLDWFRAYGLLIPSDTTAAGRRRVLFLDGKDHPDHVVCKSRIEAERASTPVISLDVDKEVQQVQRPDMTPEARKARVMAAAAEGIERQKKAAPSKWRRGR